MKQQIENNLTPTIVSLNISISKGTTKKPVDEIIVTEQGMAADGHAGDWHRQISLLAKESIDRMNSSNDQFRPGDFAENITTVNIDLVSLALGTRLLAGDEVELEVTQIGKKCHGSGCAIYRQAGDCIMPKEGIFARVVRPGTLRTGMEIRIKS